MYLYHLARTPLGSALVATWQYLIPRAGFYDPLILLRQKLSALLQQTRSLSSGARGPESSNKNSTIDHGGCTAPPSV